MAFEWDEDNPTLRAITTAAYRARSSPPLPRVPSQRCEVGCAPMPVDVGLLHSRICGPSRGRLAQSCVYAR